MIHGLSKKWDEPLATTPQLSIDAQNLCAILVRLGISDMDIAIISRPVVKDYANNRMSLLAEARHKNARQQNRDLGKQVEASIFRNSSEITFSHSIFCAFAEEYGCRVELENKWT